MEDFQHTPHRLNRSAHDDDWRPTNVKFVFLESLVVATSDRKTRCVESTKLSFNGEVDVNFLAQRGLLSLSIQHPPKCNDRQESADAAIQSHLQQMVELNYSLNSIISAKEERQPFRVNDSDYYMIEMMKFMLRNESERLVARIFHGQYEIREIMTNLISLKYWFLAISNMFESYGNRLGNTSELIENNFLLNSLL
jgi:hypothetical protein